MRTIKPITDEQIASLRSSPQACLINFTAGYGIIELPARIVQRITVVGDCWITGGHGSGNGYAKIKLSARVWRMLHRVVYTLLIGKITEGLVLDHDKSKGCTSRSCCNPWHMEEVTMKVNTERGDAPCFPKMEKVSQPLSEETFHELYMNQVILPDKN